MVINKRGRALIEYIIAIIIFAVLLFVIYFWSGNTFSDVINYIRPYSAIDNTRYIKNFCNYYCGESNEEVFCNESKELNLGDGKTIKGSCAALSEVFIANLKEGISSCINIDCDFIEPAVCYKERRRIDCSEFG